MSHSLNFQLPLIGWPLYTKKVEEEGWLGGRGKAEPGKTGGSPHQVAGFRPTAIGGIQSGRRLGALRQRVGLWVELVRLCIAFSTKK